MARSRFNRATSAQYVNEDALTGPSLAVIFKDFTQFVDKLLQYSQRICEDLQALESQHYRTQLKIARTLQSQVLKTKRDVSDVSRSQFDGLRRVFRGSHPECIVLDHLDSLLSELKLAWKEFLPISNYALGHKDAFKQHNSFQADNDAISSKIKRARGEWEEIPANADSPLCSNAIRMIEGNDTGSIKAVQPVTNGAKTILRENEGLWQEWHCPGCPNTVKFFVRRKNTSLEAAAFPPRLSDDPVRNKVAWRQVWCAKSHLKAGLGAKYACLFCVGEGKVVRASAMPCPAFDKTRDLLMHIADSHTASTLPAIFMQRLHVVKASEQGAGRSDLTFLRE